MKAFHIRPIPLVLFAIPKAFFTYKMNWGQPLSVITYVWQISGPKLNIIVDPGGTAEILQDHGFSAYNIQSLEEGLSKVGLEPKDIDIVICTHLHYDHTELAGKYPKAEFIVQKKELDAAMDPHPLEASAYQPKEFFEGINYKVIEGDQEIVKGVKVLFSPGHSRGGQSVCVETDEGLATITGFCCVEENINPPQKVREHLEVIPHGAHSDVIELYESMLRVKELSDIVLPIHDMGFMSKKEIP